MKKIVILFFTCVMFKLSAQKQYNCFHTQEYLWNPKTSQYDIIVERSEAFTFEENEQAKNISQIFTDGKLQFSFFEKNVNPKKNTISYKIISPSNGFTYNYVVNNNLYVIEVYIELQGKEILVKRYAFK